MPSAKAASGEFTRLNAYADNAPGTAHLNPSAFGGLGLEKMGLPKP
jgi:hypothetical protein